jgi:tetratricopeptide (TPR) repeat protein
MPQRSHSLYDARMSIPFRLRVLLAVVATAAGATPWRATAFDCPARGGRPWRELTTDHYVIATDLPTSEAAELAQELERMWAGVAAALFKRPPSIPGRQAVVAFQSESDFHEFAPQNVGAFYAHLGDVERLIVMPGKGMVRGRGMLPHEIAHHLTSFVLMRQPAWLREGLAVYLEPLASVGLGAKMKIGTLPEGVQARARKDRVPMRELFAWDGQPVEFHLERYYHSSWLLVSYLLNKKPQAFGELQQRLAKAEAPDAAWRAAFPEYDPEKRDALESLEDALDVFTRGGARYREIEVEVHPTISERRLASAEVHAIRLRLWGLRQGGWDEAAHRAEVAETLAEDPGELFALQARAALDKTDLVAAGRAATAAHPESWRAWRLLGEALGKTDAAGSQAAFRKAAEVAPEEPAALNDLAWALLEAGQSGAALPIARKAAALAPYSGSVLDTLAAVAADLGQCADALRLQLRAIDVLSERAPEQMRKQMAQRLAGYREQCGSAR